jgi:tetrahydromethanopterin:alpha-L-glutamate ligase
VPRTLVTQELEAAAEVIRDFGTAVVKPLYGSFGIGIERVGPDMVDDLIPAFLERHGVVYVQEYIPNEGRDLRVFVVGDDIPAAVYRVACKGQWKTNVHQGSTCEPCNPTNEVRELCLQASRIAGLEYTGVDLIEGPDGPVILELNGTPTWYGLYGATGQDVATDVVSHILRLLETGQEARQPVGLRPR